MCTAPEAASRAPCTQKWPLWSKTGRARTKLPINVTSEGHLAKGRGRRAISLGPMPGVPSLGAQSRSRTACMPCI